MKNQKPLPLLIFLLLSILLTGCRSSSYDAEAKYPGALTATKMSEDIIKYFENKDIESLKSMFCQTIQDTHNLDGQIAGAFEFIDGEIISYDEPKGSRGGGEITAEDGWVEMALRGRIENIITDTERKYRIIFHSYAIYKEDENKVGITYINIVLYDNDVNFVIGEVIR